MASPNIYPSGFGLSGTVFDGAPSVLTLSAYLSGSVQWLDTISGSNANSGALPELPVQTLAQAVTNSAANGVIIIGAGSAETIASTQSLALGGLMIIGCGSGTSRPRYTLNANTILWDITGTGTRLRNIYFPASTTGGATVCRVRVGASSCEIQDCYFECGANDGAGTGSVQFIASSSSTEINGCTFLATASRPNIGLAVTAASTDVEVKSCIFDGGSFGWSDYAVKVSAAALRARFEGNTFSRRSDLGFTITGTTYQIFNNTMDGTSNVLLTA